MPESPAFSHDFVVIGGGSAGYAAARTAAAAGLETAVVDGAETLGGLCILRGCMPSKTLLESANRHHSARRAAEFGLRAGALEVHPGEIRERKRRLIGEFAAYRQGQLSDGRFELIRGRACFTGPEQIEITARDGGRRVLAARRFLIATGSEPWFPDVPGLAESGCWTSDEVLDNERLPESIIVLGGGPVALELAWFYQALEVPVTVIQRSPRLVKAVDGDLADALRAGLEAKGMRIETGTRLAAVRRTGGGFEVAFDQDGQRREAAAAALLCALGRSPATSALGLETAGIELAGNHIATGPDQRTSNPRVFAAGDACGPHEVVHLAIEQGETAAANAAADLGFPAARRSMDYRLKLFGMFTQPELAVVGLGEDEAAAAGRAVVTATYPFDDHGKSLVMGETEGLVKLVADAATGELLGGGVVGPHASELIHEVAVALAFRATAGAFARVPHYHPTLSEIWTYPAEEIAERFSD
jgi:pyruvate/2-oxoglutarate dehydrogenase complex dihydrolipoamide dehydrogenase (E3) component